MDTQEGTDLTRPRPLTPELSIVIATIQGWPTIGAALQAIRPQAEGRAVEVIVVDGSGGPEPPDGETWPGLRWLRHPRRSTYQLRPLGYREARAPVVAATEDHCLVAPDWVERIIDAHREHPEAAVVGGALQNGSTRRLLDRASFLVTHARFMPPLPNGPSARIPGPANLSFKRSTLERLPQHDSLGVMEGIDAQSLVADGQTLVLDDRIRVRHIHEFELPVESAMQFHDGRTVSGLRGRAMEGRDWARVATLGVLPLARTARTMLFALRKGVPSGEVARLLPLILWLQYCHALGELTGYVAGPGSSPHKLV
jgi:hypothetical protein